ncbi:EAL domain-containing protein [Candidatus Electronema sp. JM]|uniref:sensor domain-containing protein n=1 Tax=Candidatus Electronema sp. JM TaxID=3401571 RepID=UPI003AA87A3D
MSREEDRPDAGRRALFCMAAVAAAVIPAAAVLLLESQAAGWRMTHPSLASLLLGWSAVAAILSSLFITVMRQTDNAAPCSVWIAAALAGMGVLDGCNALSPPPEVTLWLHSAAALVGGFFLALSLLPDRAALHPVLEWLPCIVAACCALPGSIFLAAPELIPAETTVHAVSISGGVGFFAAGLRFAWKARLEPLLLAGCSLFLAIAACFFPYTAPWSVAWWLWQLLRLAALFFLLAFFLRRCRHNIRQLRRSRDELNAARNQLVDLIENSPSAVTLKDISGHFVFVNRRFEELFGIQKKDVVGKCAADVLPNLTRQLKTGAAWTETVTEYEESISLSDGTRTFLTSCFTLPSSDCVGCIQTDITERRNLEQRLLLDQMIIENAAEAVVVTDSEAIILDVNAAYTDITGYSREEAVGKNPRINKSGHHSKEFYEEMWRQLIENGSWSGEIWDRRKNGEVFEKWLTISAIRDSSNVTINYVGIFNDITEKRNVERKLKNLLFYDPLTKLPNRTLFQERLEQAMLTSQHHDIPLALFCIDLDRFKDVNDALGHKAGDELLAQAAKRIRGGVRQSDVVARLCGDEFTVILSEVKFRESVSHLARRLIHLLQQPFHLGGEEVFVNASIGISLYPDDGRDADSLIRNADTAMHFAKKRGRGDFQHFRAQMNEKLVQRINLEKQLHHALEEGQFALYYQPKYSLAEARFVGAEALIRWLHPEEGVISPAEFIPIAEESGLISELGAWSLLTACRQMKEWERQGLGPLRLAVNLSSRQLKSRELLLLLRNTLAETGFAPALLELEITESAVMEDPELAVELLREIQGIGVRIAIDDFGTGYSSLAYLKKFPVNTLKIDQSFVADLTKDSDDEAIVDSIIQMAHGLNLEVVAEGVETEEQLKFFQARKCHEVQGYYFSKPLPAEQFFEKIREAEHKQLSS